MGSKVMQRSISCGEKGAKGVTGALVYINKTIDSVCVGVCVCLSGYGFRHAKAYRVDI